MKNCILTALAVAMLIVGLPDSGQAATNPNVYLIGDSISYRGTDNLRSLGVHWQINAFPGRTLTPLSDLIAARLAQGPAPRTLIVELGTNVDATNPYTEGDFRSALAQLPHTTRVVLVTPYRDPAKYDPSVWSPSTPATAAEFASMMAHIAATRKNTCIAPWARFASRHRYLLADGIHPKGPYKPHWGSRGPGQQAWAKFLRRAVGRCAS